MVFILGKAKHTVDVVDLLTRPETLERQVLETSQEISGRQQNSWSSRRHLPRNIVRSQHCSSDKGIG
jgi:hypothetical protein